MWPALTCSIFIKAAESIFDHVFGVSTVELFTKHGQEHSEIDRSWSLVDHAFQVIVCWVLTCKSLQSVVECRNLESLEKLSVGQYYGYCLVKRLWKY